MPNPSQVLKIISLFYIVICFCGPDESPDMKLYNAVGKNDIDMVKMLLSKGANPNATIGVTPSSVMWLASYKGYVGILNELIKSGGNVNLQEGESPLFGAITNGSYGTITVLIKNGAEVNHYEYGRTPLIQAVTAQIDAGEALQDPSCPQTLIAWKERLLKKRWDIIVYFLLRTGANPMLPDSKGVSALAWAETERLKKYDRCNLEGVIKDFIAQKPAGF